MSVHPHATSTSTATGRTVLLAGATGLVGRELLRGLLAEASVATVHALVRRPLADTHPKLVVHLVDFAALPPLPAAGEVYLALGTTIRVAGSQAAFRTVDFDANLAVAQAARSSGALRAGLVSAMGADLKSRVFYNRVKGELEAALPALGFEGLVIARPSLLVGERASLGQPHRPGETVGLWMDRCLGLLIPRDYRAIAAADVAAALLQAVPASTGVQVLRSGVMQKASAQGQA
ncbi:MAG: nucleoside-diphosphate sugar epimerase [Ramlibacter sp.]|uniref:nucleoside-diphosphate sugar epimerase n=1 Tax=Ramlibacter sp. TaxID=1917967 RepID=UPI002604CC1E|nr:nucleoside-diphosphate sugar epimerase [Ramlibacter sp.]MDH4377654.1 nucleoside-diphosphate sugar epimerase [Ramlibacter sp.]